MLTEQTPNDVLLEWAKHWVKNAYDRPWFYTEPPVTVVDNYYPRCRCNKAVRLNKFVCQGNSGYVYLGQCENCQTILWNFIQA